MHKSACVGKSREADWNKISTPNVIPTPMPLTSKEQWRRIINSHLKERGEEEYEINNPEIVLGVLRFGGTCGLKKIAKIGEIKKMVLRLQMPPVFLAEQRGGCFNLEKKTERECLLKKYLNGETRQQSDKVGANSVPKKDNIK